MIIKTLFKISLRFIFFSFLLIFININNIFSIEKTTIPTPQLPQRINPTDPIIIESISVSNDVNMQYTINIKNNTTYTISLKSSDVKIYHIPIKRKSGVIWEPSIEFLKPSSDISIPPNRSVSLIYRCKNSQEEILKKMDEEYLVYNSENLIRVCIKYNGKEYSYDETFIWKPKISDLRIKDVEIEYVHEWGGVGINNYLKLTVTLENAGNALPLFLQDKNKKTYEIPFLKILIKRREDQKIVAFLNAYPIVKNERESFLNVYLDSYFRIFPGEKQKLVFKTDQVIPEDLVGNFDITIGFDDPIQRSNVYYYHFFSDSNWQNNIMNKQVFLGEDCFEIVSFYPEKISSLVPTTTKKEFPRKEINLMYIKINSYLALSHFNDIDKIKIYFNNEFLRIFSIQFLAETHKYSDSKVYSRFLIWVEKPKNIQRGRFKVDILGVSKFSGYMESSKEFNPLLPSGYEGAPFYFYSIPINYFLISISDKNSPYGLSPITIEDINLRSNNPINILLALRPKGYTWLEYGKGWSDVQKENPKADLSKYVSSLSSLYNIYVLIRPKDEILWKLIDLKKSPKTLEADKRNIISFNIDDVKYLMENKLKSGTNELLIILTYTYKDKDGFEREEISDMYWTEFSVK